ncbi:MAG: hypothetical protein WC374_12880 [Phycisphaerae bacterium]|jgi:hypothetical protein
MRELEEEYVRLKENHRKAIQVRLARITIGPSIGRVLRRKTKDHIWPILTKIPVDEIVLLNNEQTFKDWFKKQLVILARKIDETNGGNDRIYPGYKWGHATKILCLYLNDIVMHGEYFSQEDRERIKYWLYCPVDSQVMKSLKRCGVHLPFTRIKDIDTEKKFFNVQDMLKEAADRTKVPRIYFDDNWADRG